MLFAYAAIVFAALFLVILILLHFLKPELAPSWRMISEYEIGRFGWMMRLAFFCWGASLLTLLISIWPSLLFLSGTLSRAWLILIVVTLFGAGIFKTDPITDLTRSLANTLHTIFGALTILTFPFAATVTIHSLLERTIWQSVQGWLIFGTVLVWIGLVAYFASIIISRRLDPSAGRVGPKIYQGWPNRFMAVTYVIWLIIIAGNALRLL